ncbi:hypothetical protein ACFVZD_41405 [Streptomyces sp. NPDC058287]|uniref:hypothetical protein n=1 Tax=Streptomyces sp. NPDC058287 TaxID=3346423 RepID=UPI0036E7D50E
MRLALAATRKTSITAPVFSLPNQPERLVVPQPALDDMAATASTTKTVSVELSPRLTLTLWPNTLSAAVSPVPLDPDQPPKRTDFPSDFPPDPYLEALG